MLVKSVNYLLNLVLEVAALCSPVAFPVSAKATA